MAKDGADFRGPLDCAVRIVKRAGLAGLFQGVKFKLLQTCVNAAVMFLAREKIFLALSVFFSRATTVQARSLVARRRR
jgi:hypothetical protein